MTDGKERLVRTILSINDSNGSSCVGRRLVLKQRVDEEVESVRDTLGKDTVMTGFYSYGEICPIGPGQKQAELHNQTMTITTFSEHSCRS